MSRYHPNPRAKFVYEVVESWRDECLIKDGSMFGDNNVWNLNNLNDDFMQGFMESFLLSDLHANRFLDRLLKQLKHINAGPETYQLIAEFSWILFLASSAIGANAKRKNIRLLWEKSKKDWQEHKYLQDKYINGIGHPGTAFAMNIWRELICLILFVREIKKLKIAERETLLKSDGKEVSRRWDVWGGQWSEYFRNATTNAGNTRLRAENRQIRHMLLHLIFPDYFERSFSNSDKENIIRRIKNIKIAGMSWTEKDEIIHDIRKERESHYGTTDIDFYMPPLHHDWSRKKPSEDDTNGKNGETMSTALNTHLNKIFYGPPGTGKTYHTINAAMKIIEPIFYAENSSDDKRENLKALFDQLKGDGQIDFVTFHQSFGYEEFVEGIRPVMETSDISYEIKDGVFKQICNRAADADPVVSLDDAIDRFKNDCPEDKPVTMYTPVRKYGCHVWHKEGTRSFYMKSLQPRKADGNPVPWTVSFNRLRKIYHGPKAGGINVRMILEYLRDNYGLGKQKNYVLIIDEINRGNISRIFGELITLIEESKRAKNKEAATVTLPYSGKKFEIPNNLYIIGTMNTADRSIALLDTALRRRFRFVEMMPDVDLLAGVLVDGVDIEKLLATMNKRIEALYDRDHQIGHSYFMRLKDDAKMETLKDIFLHEVLPLLQEYFYDDWEKINLIFNDNGFLSSKNPPKMKNNDVMDENKKIWGINKNLFDVANRYQKIYDNSAQTDDEIDRTT